MFGAAARGAAQFRQRVAEGAVPARSPARCCWSIVLIIYSTAVDGAIVSRTVWHSFFRKLETIRRLDGTMVSSAREVTKRAPLATGATRRSQIDKNRKRVPSRQPKKRSLLPPQREITLRPVTVPSGLRGSVQKLRAEVARLEKLPVSSRYRKQRLQVVNHALKLATATGTISSRDEDALDKLLSSLSL